VKFIQHGNIPLWAGWRLAGGLLGCLLGLKIGLGDWLTGSCLLGLKIGLLAGVGTLMGSIGKQVLLLLHNHCGQGTGAGTSGSICIAAHTHTHCARWQA